MATISRFSAVASVGRLQLQRASSPGCMWLAVHLVYIIGFKHRITTLLHWAVSFLGRGRAERVVTEQQVFARTGDRRTSATSSTPSCPGWRRTARHRRRHRAPGRRRAAGPTGVPPRQERPAPIPYAGRVTRGAARCQRCAGGTRRHTARSVSDEASTAAPRRGRAATTWSSPCRAATVDLRGRGVAGASRPWRRSRRAGRRRRPRRRGTRGRRRRALALGDPEGVERLGEVGQQAVGGALVTKLPSGPRSRVAALTAAPAKPRLGGDLLVDDLGQRLHRHGAAGRVE